jgi:hypothetical protein
MKKSIISAIAVTAIFAVCPLLQSCADTSGQTTYTTSSDPGYAYNSDPGYGYNQGYGPAETTTTTTTTNNDPDGGNVVGAVVDAPFEIVGDTLGLIF